LKSSVEKYDDMITRQEDIELLIMLMDESGNESEESDEFKEAHQLYMSFSDDLDGYEILSFLSGKFDKVNCFLSINAGAGGTDAQDWAQMLLRMYTRWIEKQGYSYEVVDESMGDEAGLKSTTLLVKGEYSYGYLKNESGIHRLVRLSPFNSNNKRQTSFASVEAFPEVKADFSEVDIDPKDLKVDTYRASGAGGQHVNKTDSAVRFTHLPTGITAQSQSSRSQISNRETALSLLKSRLIQVMEKEHKEKVDELRGNLTDIGWGHQIRSYVFHPYKMVKDLRTLVETTDVPGVMNGNLTPFIHANLRNKK
jgi:peptide chain release factor 2